MTKRICIPATIALVVSLSQAGAQMTSSPYTVFAAGQVMHSGFGVNMAMGGTGIGLPSSRSLNPINPASYSGIDTLSFLFDVGIFAQYDQYKTSNTVQHQFNGNLHNIAMGFRLMKWWSTSLGVAPYSSVGYRIQATAHIDGDLTEYTRTFSGKGGINQFYSGHSFRPFKNLSLGLNLSYLFGTISQDEVFSSGGQFGGYQLEKTNFIHSLYTDFGLQFSLFPHDWKCTLGMVYGYKKDLKNSTEINLTRNNKSIELKGESSDFSIPAKYGIGLGFKKSKDSDLVLIMKEGTGLILNSPIHCCQSGTASAYQQDLNIPLSVNTGTKPLEDYTTAWVERWKIHILSFRVCLLIRSHFRQASESLSNTTSARLI